MRTKITFSLDGLQYGARGPSEYYSLQDKQLFSIPPAKLNEPPNDVYKARFNIKKQFTTQDEHVEFIIGEITSYNKIYKATG